MEKHESIEETNQRLDQELEHLKAKGPELLKRLAELRDEMEKRNG